MTQALAHAVVLHSEAAEAAKKAGGDSAVADLLGVSFDVLKQVFSECPSFDEIVPALLAEGGIERLPERCHFRPGVPVKPMLAKPTNGVREVLHRFSDVEFTCEYKYDGERAQIHLLPDGTVKIFSRNQEDNTPKFPDVIRALPGYLQEGVQSVVIDAEAVAFDRDAGKILPFQILSTRGRKNIDEEDIKVRVAIYAFDCLFLNGVNLLQEPLTKRREALYSAFKEVPGEFFFVTAKISRDVDELQVFLEDSIAENTEGLIVKTMDATYEPSKRSLNWLKLKKDYMEGCGDSLDLVPIGAFHGRGKRTGVYGAYLLACYDEETEDLQSICKIGTGFSDEDLNALSESLRGTVIDAPKSYFKHGDFKPDVWFDPSQVWEVKAADLSVSPRTRRRRGSWTRTRASRCVSRDFCGGARIRRWRWRRRLSRWRTFTTRRRSSRTTSSTTRMGSRERRRAGRVRLRVHKSWSRECRVARRVAFERGDLPSSASSTRLTRYFRAATAGPTESIFCCEISSPSSPGVSAVERARGWRFASDVRVDARAPLHDERREGGVRVERRRRVVWPRACIARCVGGAPGPLRETRTWPGRPRRRTRSAAGDAAARVAEAARAAEPLLDMKQRTTHDDCEGFMGFGDVAVASSVWKPSLRGARGSVAAPCSRHHLPVARDRILHVDMDCFFASVAALGRSRTRISPSPSPGPRGRRRALELHHPRARVLAVLGHANRIRQTPLPQPRRHALRVRPILRHSHRRRPHPPRRFAARRAGVLSISANGRHRPIFDGWPSPPTFEHRDPRRA